MHGALLALPFGLLIGLSLGLVGGGGSILAVPILVYVFGQSPQAATGESLVIVGAAAVFGVVDEARAGELSFARGLEFAGAGIVGSLPGTAVSRQIDSHVLLLGFSVVIAVAALAMLRPAPQAVRSQNAQPSRAAAAGCATGFLTGLFGVGGGFIIVPALVTLLGLPLRAAIATSLLVIALTSGAAFVAHAATGPIAWTLSFAFAAAAIVGIVAGGRLRKHVPVAALKTGFAFLLLAVAAAVSLESVVAAA